MAHYFSATSPINNRLISAVSRQNDQIDREIFRAGEDRLERITVAHVITHFRQIRDHVVAELLESNFGVLTAILWRGVHWTYSSIRAGSVWVMSLR